MASAMSKAVEAGREAFLAGPHAEEALLRVAELADRRHDRTGALQRPKSAR